MALKDGSITTFPFVAASYHVTVLPVAVAVNFWIGEVSHAVWFPPDVAVGAGKVGIIVTIATSLA